MQALKLLCSRYFKAHKSARILSGKHKLEEDLEIETYSFSLSFFLLLKYLSGLLKIFAFAVCAGFNSGA